tara:strand:- start:205 stop:378 length:174 start_codon:yes stop_codon:yes gene_type:complete
MSKYFIDKYIRCKEEHKPKLIKIGKYWAEIDGYDELCEWCIFGLDYNNEEVINENNR